MSAACGLAAALLIVWMAASRASRFLPHTRVRNLVPEKTPVGGRRAMFGAIEALCASFRATGLAKRRRREIERDLPAVVDLYRIALAGGYNVTTATSAISSHLDGPLAEELAVVCREAGRGRRLSDALDAAVERTTDSVRPLIGALTSADRYGAPLSTTLDRLAFEVRAEEERRIERAGKHLTVELLFPVASCTLPAFVLLTMAPLLAGSFGQLASSFS